VTKERLTGKEREAELLRDDLQRKVTYLYTLHTPYTRKVTDLYTLHTPYTLNTNP